VSRSSPDQFDPSRPLVDEPGILPRADVIGVIRAGYERRSRRAYRLNHSAFAPGIALLPHLEAHVVQRLNIDGDGQGDLIWKTEKFERR
jgi:hypothetical protein